MHIEIGEYICKNKASMRAAADYFGVSDTKIRRAVAKYEKETGEKVWKWTSEELTKFDPVEVAEYILKNKCSQLDAANHFKVSQPAISAAMAKYRKDTGKVVTAGRKVVETSKIFKYFRETGATTAQMVSEFGVSASAIRRALRISEGREKEKVSGEMKKKLLAENHGYSCPPIGLIWKAPPQSQASA